MRAVSFGSQMLSPRVQRALFNLTKLFGSGKVLRWQLSLTAVKMDPS